MGEVEFILITLIFVLLVLLIVNRIVVRYNREKRIVPHEDFDGELNDLEKIIEGVSLKEKNLDEEIEDKTENSEEQEEEEEEEEEEEKEQETSKKKRPRRINNSLKNAIITKEILTPKHDKQE